MSTAGPQSVSLTRSDYFKLAGLVVVPAITLSGFMLSFMWTTNQRMTVVETNQLILVEAVGDLKDSIKEHIRIPSHPGAATRADIEAIRVDINQIRMLMLEQKRNRDE